jgi:acyl-CoA synthetase (AMP-forming)/AMP-acid ligase II
LIAVKIPELWELFDRDGNTPSPGIKEPLEDDEDRVAIYIHSSGTTGKSHAALKVEAKN